MVTTEMLMTAVVVGCANDHMNRHEVVRHDTIRIYIGFQISIEVGRTEHDAAITGAHVAG